MKSIEGVSVGHSTVEPPNQEHLDSEVVLLWMFKWAFNEKKTKTTCDCQKRSYFRSGLIREMVLIGDSTVRIELAPS